MSNVFSGSYAIQDNSIIEFIKTIDFSACLWDTAVTKNFCNTYKEWILSTKNNTVIGLEQFTHSVFSNGTSQSFDMFYIKNKDRRFRCFKGEYIYHQIAWRNNWSNWKFIEDDNLEANDALVISLPFSDTGNEHSLMSKILDDCSRLNIPVLVDCAYFGICNSIVFDFSAPCITDVVFSLSKTFPVANARIGIRFTKNDDDDLMFVYNKINYNNRIGGFLGLELLKKYPPDFIYNKYNNKQQLCCNILDLEISNSVIFGIDVNHKFNNYNRGSTSNRLSFHSLYTMSDNSLKEILYANSN